MFNFMKKATEKDDKEKRKREKKERKDVKKRDRSSMSAEELLRLDEVRRSLKIPGRRKEKEKLPSGITADYSASFFAYLERDLLENSQNSSSSGQSVRAGNNWSTRMPDGLTQSDSSETSLTSLTITTTTCSAVSTNASGQSGKNLPPLPPKPPKRGILKGSRLSISSTANSLSEESQLPNGNETNCQEASNLLVRNTLQNEVIAYQNVSSHMPGLGIAVNKEEACSEEEMQTGQGSWQVSPQRAAQQSQQQQQHHHHHQGDTKLLQVITSASPSADSLTDTTNSSFATPPFSLSPIGESQGLSRWRSSASFEEQGVDLQLPEIVPLQLPEPRELTIQRQPPPRNDFGFSLRRAVIVERAANGVTQMRPVIFAEPGSLIQHNNDTGLLPGDRLIEVNGIIVDDKSREEIIDLIKGSVNSVTVKVQPVAELSELSRRCDSYGRQFELTDANIRGGTLRRSGSLRFHQNLVSIFCSIDIRVTREAKVPKKPKRKPNSVK
ncbi:Unconventional myosin-XVIIIa [Habropoda laboriosa]|uniref:Unconventional myosin-XVIIIa n=1 Tax=Habropoda laboriosa TaxID=597456 RepID=A0A0L7QR97_9HYME|nr:PREDICTED: histone-lysine N-methyltransferase, H3 lysine-79 specific-like [Habropoda laboriosa]KOC61155.1 Unconventional myosin-XVIIIa [Habropoda laboriosa]